MVLTCEALFCVDGGAIGCTALQTGVILFACLGGGGGSGYGSGCLGALMDTDMCDMVCGGGGGSWVTLAFGLGMLCDDRAVVGFGVLGSWMTLSISAGESWKLQSQYILDMAFRKNFLMVCIHASSSGLLPRSTTPLTCFSMKSVNMMMMARCY